jgi:hypothetical protein
MVPVGVSDQGELAWAAGDEKKTCNQCTDCTNTTAKSRPKPKSLAQDLSALRAQLHALTTA